VLTEWKLADEKTAADRFAEARTQTKIYKRGPLATNELRAYCYLVAVSLKDLSQAAIPNNLIEDGVTYRHINIAIEPEPLSKRAKK
jgi:hypothetical protein